jgi:peptide/nickel transport system substrate-binding protein
MAANHKTTNWWDRLGKPQYGGELTIRASRNIENFDPFVGEAYTSIYGGWMERLLTDDWTIDPAVWDYVLPWHPSKYLVGQLAESWEFPKPGVHVVHLRKGIHWQNIPPANGREVVADDVVFHYNRLLGLNNYPNPSPNPVEVYFTKLKAITAPDRYTVVFEWDANNPEFIIEALHGVMQRQCIENPDAVKKWGDVADWHHAIGTGPFILKNFIPNKEAILAKVPDYWGHDERYPQNQVPYLDTIKYSVVLDDDEALEVMRAGKLDIIDRASYAQVQAIQKTNPEIIAIHNPTTQAVTVQPRNDRAPFNDVRVRQAMQMALDLPTIAKEHYHGNVITPTPSTVMSSHLSKVMKGWGFPYEQWPQDLKDEYAYNPAAARKLLAEAGFPKGFKTNIIVDTSSDMALFKIIKDSFDAIGIEMEVRPMESNECTKFVGERKHDQLVYRQYGPLGHCYAPFQAITRFHSAAKVNWTMTNDPVIDGYYPAAIAATTEDEFKKVMKDMCERVARQHFAISLLQPLEYALCQPWVKGYHGQIHSVWMGTGGPSRLSLYGARFWIDHDLKKKLGKE